MRFSATTLLALPLLAGATQQESPLDQAKAKFDYYLKKAQSFIPNPSKDTPIDTSYSASSSTSGKAPEVLTLGDWESTIRGSVAADSTTPQEWWVLVTGGNKTCFGQCTKVETAFNDSALLFGANPSAPHFGYLNCDNQPVLCNSWAAGPPSLWILEVTPAPNPVDIHVIGLNLTTTSVETFSELHSTQSWKKSELHDGYFHPFDGPVAKYGAAVPLGYILWGFSVVPSWVFMIGISFLSRTIMGNRIAGQTNRARARAAGGAGAPPVAGR